MFPSAATPLESKSVTDNIIREGVTIHRGSEKEEGVTRIGSHNLLMVNVHVAHDCVMGNKMVITNNTILGGHTHVESIVTISGGVAIHPFVTIGSYSYVGGLSRIYHDVPRFMMVDGNPSKVRCLNLVGLKRNGLSPEAIASLHEAHRLLYRAHMTAEHASEILESHGHLWPRGAKPSGFHRRPTSWQAWPGQGSREDEMRPLRVGVVGVGHLGQHHARILAAMPGVELVAVADARADQAQAVAAPSAARSYALDDYRAMLDLVDAVTIAVPTVLHREVAGPFLLRGIATLVEKPMAASAAESEQTRRRRPRRRRRACRSAISSDSTRPCGHSSRCRSAPSSSMPNGFRLTHSARPISAWCSTS